MFARNIVNRYVGYLLGRGLVEPIDDMRSTNPPTNVPLMQALSRDFRESKFNVKHLMRTIMTSRLYQLDSQPTVQNAADNRFYSHFRVKRISAEPLLDAIDYATGSQTKYPNLPLGTRAIQLPDTKVRSFLLDVFGRPARQITCECERTSQPNIAQALHLLNSDFLNKKIELPSGRVATLLRQKKTPAQIVEELYLVTLCRRPTVPEAERARAWLAKAPSVKEGAEDLLWVLVNYYSVPHPEVQASVL